MKNITFMLTRENWAALKFFELLEVKKQVHDKAV